MSFGTKVAVQAYAQEFTYRGRGLGLDRDAMADHHKVEDLGGQITLIPPHVPKVVDLKPGDGCLVLYVGVVPVLILPADAGDYPILGLLAKGGA